MPKNAMRVYNYRSTIAQRGEYSIEVVIKKIKFSKMSFDLSNKNYLLLISFPVLITLLLLDNYFTDTNIDNHFSLLQ